MADAQDSKSCEGNFMWVQVPLPAPKKISSEMMGFFVGDLN